MKKILTILGARPQFVKAAVLSRVIQENNEIEEVIVHTGQHYDANMSDVFFDEMEIPKPKYNLQVNGLGHGAMTGQMLEKIETILMDEKPDAVVVYGDTNSTIAGALAAKKLLIKVVHIEAGLRSYNMAMPEEINRILTDRISDLLCCPTDTAVKNLNNEGFANMPIEIVKTGDIMKDAVEYYSRTSQDKSSIIRDLNLESGKFVLATIHRQENTDDPEKLKSIFAGLDSVNEKQPVILPLHPRTKKMMEQHSIQSNISFIDPIGYFSMMELLKHCSMVVTDSGGLQKEAFFHKKHCIIVRDETEWVELVDHGYAEIVGHDANMMIDVFTRLISSSISFERNLYGNMVGETIYKAVRRIL